MSRFMDLVEANKQREHELEMERAKQFWGSPNLTTGAKILGFMGLGAILARKFMRR